MVFRLREKFHDWLWSGGEKRISIAKRLPIYFADPYYPKDYRRHPWKREEKK